MRTSQALGLFKGELLASSPNEYSLLKFASHLGFTCLVQFAQFLEQSESLITLFYFNYKKQKETISFLVSKLFSPEFCDIFQTMVFSITRAACILLILAGGRHDLKALQLWVCFPPFQPNNLTFSFIVHSCSHNSLL